MKIGKILKHIINEQNVLKTTKTKPIVDAIKNRNPISFYYVGPKKPKKDSVKPGNRIKVEGVAIGLSKKGNLIIRGYVQPPSVSKKGFNKTNWRTYMVSRMYSTKIHEDEKFGKRPGYKEGEESKNGPMRVTYATTNWVDAPKITPTKKPDQKTKEIKPKITQVKKEVPSKEKVKKVEPIKPEEKPKELEPIKPQEKPQEIEPTKPEEKPVNIEPTKPEELEPIKPQEKPEDLNEEIKKIKTLIYSLNRI